MDDSELNDQAMMFQAITERQEAVELELRLVEEMQLALEAITQRAESAEFGCEIAYKREPTQAEADAHANGADECFIPMGGWTGRRCHHCRTWVFGGPTACARCVERQELRLALTNCVLAMRLWGAEEDGIPEDGPIALAYEQADALIRSYKP